MKSVAKGMIVGKVRGGGDLVVGGGDGGQVFAAPPQDWKEKEAAEEMYADDRYIYGGRESPEMIAFGRASPTYGLGAIEGQKVSGKW